MTMPEAGIFPRRWRSEWRRLATASASTRTLRSAGGGILFMPTGAPAIPISAEAYKVGDELMLAGTLALQPGLSSLREIGISIESVLYTISRL